MTYATFGYYANDFCGAAVPEDGFPRCAARASEYIDYITQGRAARANDVQYPALQDCCCAMAELCYLEDRAKAAAASGKEVRSESNGSWSQSYTTSADYAGSLTGQSQFLSVARRYLAQTGLLFRG